MPRFILLGLAMLLQLLNVALAGQSVSVQLDGWQATYSEPTRRYGHGVLGDTPEWGRLCIAAPDAEACVTLPERRVFEDIAPRLVDVNLDGRLDTIVVESDNQLGASLVVYLLGSEGQLHRVANSPVGSAFRWLAPVGAADLDGDGYVEIAYVDRPHLAKVLRVWRFKDSSLVEVAARQGFSNHRIGDAFVSGGLRTCNGQPPEMITADASWQNIVATRFDGEQLLVHRVGVAGSQENFRQALLCE